jgi:arylsulfatase A-like enzyme
MGKVFKNYFSLILLLGSLNTSAQQKPNIILFMVDDMGWMDTSVPFGDSIMALNKMFHTPNMERMAQEGMKFTSAYTTPVCTPTRVSLMTGMNAARHGITNWTSIQRDTPSDGHHIASVGGVIKESALVQTQEVDNFVRPDWNYNGYSPVEGIPKTTYATPLPKLLNDIGYFTIHVGKAHFASFGTPGASPYNLGFVVNIAGTMAGMPQSFFGHQNYGNLPEKTSYYAVQNMAEYYGTDTYLTEAITLEALKTLEYPIKTKQPFFLFLSHYAVHLPLNADNRFIQRYYEAGLDSGQAKYGSMIEGMDKSLGDVMNYLKQKNLEKNTILIFISDNGGISVSPEKGGQLHTHNLPLREGKGSVYEGGIREPMIVKWPGVVKPGSKTDQPIIIEDFFPTFLELAGIDKPDIIQETDGISFMPLLKGIKHYNPERAFIWHYPHRWKTQTLPQIDYMSAVRQGDWKLVYDMKTQKLELYDLKNDIGELNDLSMKNPEKVKQLAALLGNKLRSMGALMPSYVNTGKVVPWPDEILIPK